jgi:uncharacterized integral membrane protein (TIGR00698 family)
MPARATLPGLCFVGGLSMLATWIATLPALQALRISPLVVGILIGVVIGNTVGSRLPSTWDEGRTFSAKRVLRLAIVLYGFRITFGQIATLGWPVLLLDVLMVSLTLGLGAFVGIRWLKMEVPTALMTAAGAAICGAAAVIATEPVVKAKGHQTAAAVATVVVFGTLAMFLYPLAYRTGLVPMDLDTFGIYIGASVHEVAHVVGAGEAVSPDTADTAVIVKMTRVLLLAPALIVMGLALQRGEKEEQGVVIPWFAVGFIAVAGINSLNLFPAVVVDALIQLDTFLLTMAMTALGLNTVASQFKGMGYGPLLLALTLFGWLIFGGFALTHLLMGG